jgi:CubicO group peptidase (beta-lactamase class C family)
MKIRARSATVFVALALLISTALADQADSPRLEKAVQMRVSKGQFMGAVLVARSGRTVLSKGYGMANLEWHVPNSPRTRFRIGSLTKQFTAASVLLLEERGKLNIADPISRYMPDAPPAWRAITVFNLLTHTSGIPDLTTFPDFDATEAHPATPDELVGRFRDKPLDFPPGTAFKYSNSGYILLGYLIEKITGQTYRQFVQENIFRPLGMKNSGYDSNTEIVFQHAQGYASGKTGLVVAGYVDMSIPFAAGGLYSTTEDLLRWEEALYGGKLLSAASLTKMTTPFKGDYAFGVAVDLDARGNRVIRHGGAIEGFGASLIYVPAERLSVIVLSNIEGPSARDVSDAILKITNHEFTVPKH